jgi:GntR family transcriptional regulator
MADLARSVSDDEQVAAPNMIWQRVALDIANRIRSGETPVGSKIASYEQLAERHGASYGTIKRAIEYLRETGVLQGAQGSGVFVLKVPDDDIDFTAPSSDEVAGRVARIEDTLKRWAAARLNFAK